MNLDHYTANQIINNLVELGIAGIVGNYSTDLLKSGCTKAVELGRKLWQTIRDRLVTDSDAKTLIYRVEQDKSEKHLKMLVPCLEEAMNDRQFAEKLFQLVNQIDVESGNNINKNFTAKDNSAVINQASAQNIGGQHNHYYNSVPEKKL